MNIKGLRVRVTTFPDVVTDASPPVFGSVGKIFINRKPKYFSCPLNTYCESFVRLHENGVSVFTVPYIQSVWPLRTTKTTFVIYDFFEDEKGNTLEKSFIFNDYGQIYYCYHLFNGIVTCSTSIGIKNYLFNIDEIKILPQSDDEGEKHINSFVIPGSFLNESEQVFYTTVEDENNSYLVRMRCQNDYCDFEEIAQFDGFFNLVGLWFDTETRILVKEYTTKDIYVLDEVFLPNEVVVLGNQLSRIVQTKIPFLFPFFVIKNIAVSAIGPSILFYEIIRGEEERFTRQPIIFSERTIDNTRSKMKVIDENRLFLFISNKVYEVERKRK